MDLTDFQDAVWEDMQKLIKQLSQRVNRNELFEQAQVGRGTPRYANYAALPTGALGQRACVEDTGYLYFHDGTSWKRVLLIDPAVTYAVSNGGTDRTYDANGTDIPEIADVVYSMLSDLGLI